MNTAYGKLMTLFIVVLLAIVLFAPMRSGINDRIVPSVDTVNLTVGESVKIGYSLFAESAQTVVFSSDDSHIVSVDQIGQITAVSPGKTTIRLRAQDGASNKVIVTVAGTPVTDFYINTPLLSLEKGEVSGLSCVFNAGVRDRRVTWSSSNPEVATVDGAGRVSAHLGGTAIIRATTVNGLIAESTIKVHCSGTALSVTPGDMTVGVGATFPLKTRFLPEDATETITEWVSSDPTIVSVDEDGVIHANGIGLTTITAHSDEGLSGNMIICVDSAPRQFSVDPTELTIERGDAHTLPVRFFDAYGNVLENVDHHIVWTSAEPRIASVENGVITGIASGMTRITAVADGFESVCTVTVKTSVRSIELETSEVYLLREDTNKPLYIRASLVPADADDQRIFFDSDNTLVANVDSNGKVTLTGGYGTAHITVSSRNGAEAVYSVHVVTQLPESTEEVSTND